MLQHERHEQILRKLDLEGKVSVQLLAKEFKVTQDCIRKDLNILEKNNQCKRIHGGAIPARQTFDRIRVKDRKNVRTRQKKEIALQAVEYIEPGQTVYLDISTISIEIARLIVERNILCTVVTSMIDLIDIFCQWEGSFVFIGGTFNPSRDGFIGTYVIDQLMKYHFDVSFLSTVAVHEEDKGVYSYSMEDGLTKKTALSQSGKAYLVMESEKLHFEGSYMYAHTDDFAKTITETIKNDKEQ